MIRLCVGFCLQLVTRRKMYFKMPPKFLFDIKPCPFSFCPLTSSKLSHQGKEVHHLCKYKVKDSLVLSLGGIILKLVRTSNIWTWQFFVQLSISVTKFKFYSLISQILLTNFSSEMKVWDLRYENKDNNYCDGKSLTKVLKWKVGAIKILLKSALGKN